MTERDVSRFIEELGETRRTLSAENIATLHALKDLEALRQTLFRREARRLRARLGEDHPRVRDIETRAARTLDIAQGLDVASEVARSEPPAVEPEKGVVTGRVTDEQGRGIAGMDVYLTDRAGNRLEGLGAASTDDTGRYALVVDPAELEERGEAVPDEAFLAVDSPEGERIRRSKKPFGVGKGARIRAEVAVTAPELGLPGAGLAGRGGRRPRRPGRGPRRGRRSGRGRRRPRGPDAPPAESDLEAIRGIGPERAEDLRRAGIRDLEDFVDADDDQLKDVLGNRDVAEMKEEGRWLLRRPE